MMAASASIRTPDQRLRVFVSSTLGELADERRAVRRAIERLHLTPVMFELGARPHPPRQLYRAYLAQSDVFIGMYWQRYGWVAPGEDTSGLEDEFRLASGMPQLVYIKHPAPDREPELTALLRDIQARDETSYRRFETLDELERLVADDLAVLLSERFDEARAAVEDAVSDQPEAGPRPRRRSPPPVPLAPIVGRTREVAQITELLTQGTRLVTLTGPGGVGKTRLALEAARATQEPFRSDVHFVPLAAVTDPALVMPTIADQLQVRGEVVDRPLDAIAEHVGSSRALLVLDNLEQVIAARGDIAELLTRTSALQVLATSRQALRIGGEHEVVIAPLDVPDAEDDTAAIGRTSAVELFVTRAREAGQRFTLSDDNAAVVAEVCRRLEGVPLSLELAAARLRLLGPSALLERLGRVLDLGSRRSDLPGRQQTLRATLDWSFDLLDDRERSLFARIGVFAGGATLDAIEAVCGGDGIDVLDPLAGLLDKSLLASDVHAPAGQPRFRMLEPVREYAWERLGHAGEVDAIRQRHLQYFSDLGRRAQPHLCGPNQRDWAARFDAERANLRVAIATGLETGQVGTVLLLAWDTFVYYYIRDAFEEPRAWILAVAEHRDAFDEVESAMLDVGLVIVGALPDERDASAVLTAASGVFDAHDLPLEAAVTFHYLGLQRWQEGDVAGATAALEDSSRRYAAIDHDWGVAAVEATLGAVRAAMGERVRATAGHRRSLEHSRRIDNRPQMAQALQGLGLVAALEGRIDQAVDALAEAADIALSDRSATSASYCLEALGAVAAATGDHRLATQALAAAASARERLGVPVWTAASDVVGPVQAAARTTLDADDFSTAWHEGEAADPFSLLQTGLTQVTPTTDGAGADPRHDGVAAGDGTPR